MMKYKSNIPTLLVSIAGELPLLARLARQEVMDSVTGGTIGGTFCVITFLVLLLQGIELMKRDNSSAKSISVFNAI